jgi:phenylalanyl-tRNA synthetase alpha subunit
MTVLQLNQTHTSRIDWRTFYHTERERERDQAFRQHIGRMYMLQTARSEPPKHAYLDSFISISTVVAAIYGVP